MFKRILVVFAIFFVFANLICFNNTPVFEEYASAYTVCLDDNSSCGRFKTVTRLTYALNLSRFGESCTICRQDFNLHEFIKDFNACNVFIESTADGTNYYLYSDKVKYLKIINGQKVNLQVFVGENRVVLGTPIIFAGY